MKSIKLISLLICVIILACAVMPQSAYAQNADGYSFISASQTVFDSLTAASQGTVSKVKVSWTIPDIEITYGSYAEWDVNTLSWIESEGTGEDYSVSNTPATFVIENMSSAAINAKLSFDVVAGMSGIAQGATVTGSDGKAITRKGIDIGAAASTQKSTTETLKALVNILSDADFSTLQATEGSTLGTYTVTIRKADYPIEQIYDNLIDAFDQGVINAFALPINDLSVNEIINVVKQTNGTYKIKKLIDGGFYKTSDFAHLNDHLALTLKAAILYNKTADTALKDKLREPILGLIKHWVSEDYQSSNPWYNNVSTPNLLGEIALMMRDAIPNDLKAQILKVMSDGCLTINTALQSETGANATWLAMSTLKYGILSEDESIVAYAVKKLKSTLSFTSGEGIRSDGSLVSGGSRLQNGMQLIKNSAYLLYLLEGTSYQFTNGELNALSTVILSGLRYLTVGKSVDPQALGSDVATAGATDLGSLTDYLGILTTLSSMPNKSAVNAYAEAIKKGTRADYGLHYYSDTKYIVINNSDFYFSFKGCGANLCYGQDTLLGYNTSYGTTTTIAGTNVDFDSILPVLDYAYIPGTTAVHQKDSELSAYKDYGTRKLSGIFGDKYTDDYAVSFVQSQHEKVSYTVACFATDKSAIILGTGLTNSDGKTMFTTVQQEISNGKYTKNGNVYTHNGVKYQIYDGGIVTASTKKQSGSWSRISASGSAATVTKDVFTLKIANEGSYAYSVMSTNTNETYEVVCNTIDCQAVKMPSGKIIAVCYTAGTTFDYGGKTYFLGSEGSVTVFN